jgi:hypothetical protein
VFSLNSNREKKLRAYEIELRSKLESLQQQENEQQQREQKHKQNMEQMKQIEEERMELEKEHQRVQEERRQQEWQLQEREQQQLQQQQQQQQQEEEDEIQQQQQRQQEHQQAQQSFHDEPSHSSHPHPHPYSSPAPSHASHSFASSPSSAAPSAFSRPSEETDRDGKFIHKWSEIQRELQGPPYAVPPPSAPVEPSPGHAYHPVIASHLQHVQVSPHPAGENRANAVQRTERTINKVEHALELDWNSVWDELAVNGQTNRQAYESRYQHTTSTESKQQQATPAQSHSQHSTYPSSLSSHPPVSSPHANSNHPYPAPTPYAEKMAKAIVVAPAATTITQSHHQHSSASTTSIAPPSQLLTQASSLFKTTLHELEEKAQYLTHLIAAFKEAERDMVSSAQRHEQTEFSEPAYHHQQRRASYDSQAYAAESAYATEEETFEDTRTAAPARALHGANIRRHSGQPMPAAAAQPIRRGRARPTSAAPMPSTDTASAKRASSVPRAMPASKSVSSLALSTKKHAPVHMPINAPPAISIPTTAPTASRPASHPRPVTASTLRALPASLRPSSAVSSSTIRPLANTVSYPRPRTASARAARQPTHPGVRLAQSRIRSIVQKTKVKPGPAVSVLVHPKPTQAFVEDKQAKAGLKQASVQNVLLGAHEIAARKSQPAHLRPSPSAAAAAAKPKRASQEGH